jgi:signal transduction histidine kinase
MSGIEFEILEGFRTFVKDNYGVDLQLNWKEGNSFADTYREIKHANQPGIFGVSAFSVTPERQREVQFSKPYMSDISVLITSKDIPIVQSMDEFRSVFSLLTAVTIDATTYEHDLLKLKAEHLINFKIDYIPSSHNILRTIAGRDSAFGFIDLPIYMKTFANEPAINIKRQNLFPVKRQGYAIIFPRESDWTEPLQSYFNNPKFDQQLQRIIGHYIDLELYHFIESLAIQSDNLVVLLTKEKEIQYNELLGKAAQIQQDARARNVLILLIVITLISLVVIVLMYQKRNLQKVQIELQRQNIELKNAQLEKRNTHLVTLDEEKNNLIKILAHDLRTPINHLQGLAQLFLLSNPHMKEDDRVIIQKISEASLRLNKMITNILDIDSVENNRIKILMDNVVLSPLVTQVVRSFEKQAAKKHISIHLRTDANVMINGDPLFLTQVFENLISNAIKFSGIGKEINVSVIGEDECVKVAVTDSGPGISVEDQALLFKKFQRLSAKPTDGETSTGLGLSIVKKYVELMNGIVTCQSEFGKGATFTISFPSAKLQPVV